MEDANSPELSHRAEIALRDERRKLEAKERKMTMGVCGLAAYSALTNLLAAAGSFIGGQFVAAIISLVMGVCFAFGAYRVWRRDDVRWWLVGIPAMINALVATIMLLVGVPAFIPLIISMSLLVLLPLRKRAFQQLEAASGNSFNPTPPRGSA